MDATSVAALAFVALSISATEGDACPEDVPAVAPAELNTVAVSLTVSVSVGARRTVP